MKVVFLILILSVFGLSCSHQVDIDRSDRRPASALQEGGCVQSIEPILSFSVPSKMYKFEDFTQYDLEMKNFDDEINSVIDLNREPAMKEQSRIIFGLLKKLHPEEAPAELIARYQRQFSSCP